jgi:hypothetical protein
MRGIALLELPRIPTKDVRILSRHTFVLLPIAGTFGGSLSVKSTNRLIVRLKGIKKVACFFVVSKSSY